MLFHVGGDGSRPTLFEIAAASHLPDSIKAAVLYCLGITAQRLPIFHNVLDYGDEVLSVLMFFLENHSLNTLNASFGEGLFGLRRSNFIHSSESTSPSSSVNTSSPSPNPTSSLASSKSTQHSSNPPQSSASSSTISPQQRKLSIFFLVILPYLKSKLHAMYNTRRRYHHQRSLWRNETETENENDNNNNNNDDNDNDNFDHDNVQDNHDFNTINNDEIYNNNNSSSSRQSIQHFDNQSNQIESSSGNHSPYLIRLKNGCSHVMTSCFPYLYVAYEGSTFLYQLLYLLDANPFFSPSLRFMNLVVRRSTAQELINSSKIINEKRKKMYEQLNGHSIIKLLKRIALKSFHTIFDSAHTSLIAGVFIYKMLEWWFQSGEQKLNIQKTFPSPPPPPQPKVSKNGLPLPSDRRICAICQRRRTNPAMMAVSGFVFCYPCVFSYVDKYGRCPVSLIPADVNQIRRIYHE